MAFHTHPWYDRRPWPPSPDGSPYGEAGVLREPYRRFWMDVFIRALSPQLGVAQAIHVADQAVAALAQRVAPRNPGDQPWNV